MGNRWFEQLPEYAMEELIAMASVRKLKDGQFLFAKNDEPEGLYCVISGVIQIGVTTAEGRQAVFALLEVGNWLGETSMFDDRPRANSAIAKGDAEVLFIPRTRFQAMLDRQPELYKYFIKLFCEHFRRATVALEDSVLRSFPERFAKQLLGLADIYGVPCEEGIRINLHLSQEDLGVMLGTTRQRINRELKTWERNGWVGLDYGGVVIKDRAALEALVSQV